MNVQRTASAIGAYLVLLIGVGLCIVVSGVMAAMTLSIAFAVVLKTVMVLAVLVSTLAAFMKWGQGGSLRFWLGVAAASYFLSPISIGARVLFAYAVGAPVWLAWIIDGIVWMAVAWVTARRVLPKATVDDGLLRLR